jgi:hypothetical protein
MYYRLSYVSRCVLSLKIIVLYIYRPRDTMQYNQQLYTIYSSYEQWRVGVGRYGRMASGGDANSMLRVSAQGERRWNEALLEYEEKAVSSSWLHGNET